MPTPVQRIVQRYLSAAMDVGETLENGTLRVHLYMNSLHITDLTNAGKRGKKVERLVVMPNFGQLSDLEGRKLLRNITTMVEHYSTFNQAVATIKDYLRDYPDDLDLTFTADRAIDVTPAGFKPFEIKTPKVWVEADYRDFRVRNMDDPNESTCIPSIKGGKASIPAFYRWVKDNQAAIKNMSYQDVIRGMRAEKIEYHEYCAMD